MKSARINTALCFLLIFFLRFFFSDDFEFDELVSSVLERLLVGAFFVYLDFFLIRVLYVQLQSNLPHPEAL